MAAPGVNGLCSSGWSPGLFESMNCFGVCAAFVSSRCLCSLLSSSVASVEISVPCSLLLFPSDSFLPSVWLCKSMFQLLIYSSHLNC